MFNATSSMASERDRFLRDIQRHSGPRDDAAERQSHGRCVVVRNEAELDTACDRASDLIYFPGCSSAKITMEKHQRVTEGKTPLPYWPYEQTSWQLTSTTKDEDIPDQGVMRERSARALEPSMQTYDKWSTTLTKPMALGSSDLYLLACEEARREPGRLEELILQAERATTGFHSQRAGYCLAVVGLVGDMSFITGSQHWRDANNASVARGGKWIHHDTNLSRLTIHPNDCFIQSPGVQHTITTESSTLVAVYLFYTAAHFSTSIECVTLSMDNKLRAAPIQVQDYEQLTLIMSHITELQEEGHFTEAQIRSIYNQVVILLLSQRVITMDNQSKDGTWHVEGSSTLSDREKYGAYGNTTADLKTEGDIEMGRRNEGQSPGARHSVDVDIAKQAFLTACKEWLRHETYNQTGARDEDSEDDHGEVQAREVQAQEVLDISDTEEVDEDLYSRPGQHTSQRIRQQTSRQSSQQTSQQTSRQSSQQTEQQTSGVKRLTKPDGLQRFHPNEFVYTTQDVVAELSYRDETTGTLRPMVDLSPMLITALDSDLKCYCDEAGWKSLVLKIKGAVDITTKCVATRGTAHGVQVIQPAAMSACDWCLFWGTLCIRLIRRENDRMERVLLPLPEHLRWGVERTDVRYWRLQPNPRAEVREIPLEGELWSFKNLESEA